MVKVEQEPGLVCCGGGALFVVATGGCKVTVKQCFYSSFLFITCFYLFILEYAFLCCLPIYTVLEHLRIF